MMRIHSIYRYVLCWCVCNAPYKWLAPSWDIIVQVVRRNSSKMLSKLSWLEQDHEYWNAMQTAITSHVFSTDSSYHDNKCHEVYWNFTTWQLKGWKLGQAARPSEDPAAQSWPHYVVTQSNASCIFMHCLTLWRLPNRSSAFTSTSLGCQCRHTAHPHIHYILSILYSRKTNSRAALLCRSRGNPLGGRTFLVHPWCQALLPSYHARCPRRTPSAECTFLGK